MLQRLLAWFSLPVLYIGNIYFCFDANIKYVYAILFGFVKVPHVFLSYFTDPWRSYRKIVQFCFRKIALTDAPSNLSPKLQDFIFIAED